MADPKITIKVEGSGLPGGGSDGQVLTRQGGKAVWGDAGLNISDQEIVAVLLAANALPAILDDSGAIITDDAGNILLV